LSECKAMYVATHSNVDGLTGLNKELNLGVKLLKKQITDVQLVKFEHDKKMLGIQLKHENIMCECEKDKRNSKEVSDMTALKAKNAHTMLAHCLRKQTKDEDLIHWEIPKKQKDVEVLNNDVGVITAGQFNVHQTLDAVSCFATLILFSFVTHLSCMFTF
jgi:hypothetical protein